jgi:flagellar biogenesis protein FliO
MDPVRYISGLLSVGLLLGLLVWVLRRFKKSAYGRSGNLEILSVMGLGPREKLVVIRYRGREVLLGVTAHSISKIIAQEPAAKAAAGVVAQEAVNDA